MKPVKFQTQKKKNVLKKTLRNNKLTQKPFITDRYFKFKTDFLQIENFMKKFSASLMTYLKILYLRAMIIIIFFS